MMFTLDDLGVPVVAAPMAGGISTPQLAAATGAAAGLGFLAAGYRSAAELAESIARLRALTTAPFGVNVFVPQPIEPGPQVWAYRRVLEAEAAGHGVTLPEPDPGDTDDFDAKLELLLDDPVPVVSFTFGAPSPPLARRLQERGSWVVVTVTGAAEARAAVAAGADALCVQGPGAGGHRGCFDPRATPPDTGLSELLAEVSAVTRLPLIAAGGLSTGAEIAAARAAGARAVQLGTALLCADEAGTNHVHREALADPRFDRTVLTRAFSGRWARGLRNAFIDAHADAPAGYPVIDQLTKPLRAAAVRRGDAQSLHLWAGTGFRRCRSAPAADIIADLWDAAG